MNNILYFALLIFWLDMEELKPVFLEIRSKDKEKFNSILKVIKLTFSSVIIQGLTFDKIDDKFLVSFNISQKHYHTLIEKLTLNKLDVISTEASDLEIINSAKGKLRKKDNAGFEVGIQLPITENRAKIFRLTN